MADPGVDHIIFDFFGTLVTYSDGVVGNANRRALVELERLGMRCTASRFETTFADCFQEAEAEVAGTCAEYSMGSVAQRLFEVLGLAVDDADVERFVAAYLEDWSETVVPIPDLSPWLAQLVQSKSVLTNTHQPDFVPGHLRRFKIHGHVDHVTSSVDFGRRKPDPGIYEAHLERLRLDRDRVLFVGDNPECDYHGPRAVGIKAYLISPRPVAGVDERDRLSHLFQLAERLPTG